MSSHSRSHRPREQKPPDCRPDALERAALRYLERFDSTAKNLRSVLRDRVRRARLRGAELDVETIHLEIDAIVATYQAQGVIDDRRFAEARLESLRRRGDSTRMVRHKLANKGVPRELVDEVLLVEREATDDEAGGDEAELEAARRLCRRRRLGPFRLEAQREASHQRDLGALARAGFSYDIARQVLGEPREDE